MAIKRDKVIADAEKLVAKGKIEPAIKEYERLLDDNPNDVNTLNRIGDLWVRINRTDEAVKTFGKIADHYAKDGFFLKAIAIYKKINKLDPSKLDVYAKLADLYAKQGLAMEAKSQYQVLADYYIKHGDPGNALAIYRKISDLDPNSINVHVKLADLYSARSALERGLAADPNEPAIRETLAELSLRQNNPDKALEMLNPIADKALARGERGAAVEVLSRILRVDSGHTPTLERLVGVYMKLNEETNILNAMNSLAEAHIAKGRYEEASKVLEKLIQREPQNAQHRNKLSFVKSQSGGVDTVSGRKRETAARPPMPVMEIEEPVPTFELEEPPALSLDLDA